MRKTVAKIISAAARAMADAPQAEALHGVSLHNGRTNRRRQLKREWNATPWRKRRGFRAELLEAAESSRKK